MVLPDGGLSREWKKQEEFLINSMKENQNSKITSSYQNILIVQYRRARYPMENNKHQTILRCTWLKNRFFLTVRNYQLIFIPAIPGFRFLFTRYTFSTTRMETQRIMLDSTNTSTLYSFRFAICICTYGKNWID